MSQVRSRDESASQAAFSGGLGLVRDRYLLAVCLLGVAGLWIMPLRSSLWLDETGTFWVIQGSLGDVVHRALDFQGQFPAYYVLLWGWSKLAGTSEIALRLPSVFAAGVAALLCYRLAKRLFGESDVARLAACIFVLLPPVAFAAADARPYAMALAALLGSTLALVRWLDSGKRRDWLAYLVLAAATVYLHYLYALVFIPHALMAFRELRRKGRRAAAVVGATAGSLGVLLLPALPHFLNVAGRRYAMSLFTYGSVPDLVQWVVPSIVVAAFLAGSLASMSGDGLRWETSGIARGHLPFLAVWLLLPPITLFVASHATGIGLYATRHFLSSAPALALLGALAFALLSSRQQRIAVGVLAILSVAGYGGRFHTGTDWRTAAATVNALSDGPTCPILVYTGFSESGEMDWILDEQQSQLFLAPFAAYPIEGRTYPLPFTLTAQAREYVQSILTKVEPGAERLLLITSEPARTYDVWLSGQMGVAGYTYRQVGIWGDVRLVVFER